MINLSSQKPLFNPKIEQHRKAAENYVKSALSGNATWGKSGCPFSKSTNFTSVDAEVRTKLLAFYMKVKVK